MQARSGAGWDKWGLNPPERRAIRETTRARLLPSAKHLLVDARPGIRCAGLARHTDTGGPVAAPQRAVGAFSGAGLCSAAPGPHPSLCLLLVFPATFPGKTDCQKPLILLERAKGIEPSSSAWKLDWAAAHQWVTVGNRWVTP